ncbi:MAG TPA: type II toxin-antitoxin system mRNA interferase toxin, RelE/StbE family [Candidatus Cloacimonetes bacterium]|nr:type II toxin-antitoxin system mRNA interferase toxin, RelE/StbE family [Candidatus Cloacimonadota bacterium]
MEKFKILIKKSVEKDFSKLSKKDIQNILKLIESLSENPFPKKAKKLTASNKYRIRYRNIRILYKIENKILIIIIFKIAHRKDVYRM